MKHLNWCGSFHQIQSFTHIHTHKRGREKKTNVANVSNQCHLKCSSVVRFTQIIMVMEFVFLSFQSKVSDKYWSAASQQYVWFVVHLLCTQYDKACYGAMYIHLFPWNRFHFTFPYIIVDTIMEQEWIINNIYFHIEMFENSSVLLHLPFHSCLSLFLSHSLPNSRSLSFDDARFLCLYGERNQLWWYGGYGQNIYIESFCFQTRLLISLHISKFCK